MLLFTERARGARTIHLTGENHCGDCEPAANDSNGKKGFCPRSGQPLPSGGARQGRDPRTVLASWTRVWSLVPVMVSIQRTCFPQHEASACSTGVGLLPRSSLA